MVRGAAGVLPLEVMLVAVLVTTVGHVEARLVIRRVCDTKPQCRRRVTEDAVEVAVEGVEIDLLTIAFTLAVEGAVPAETGP